MFKIREEEITIELAKHYIKKFKNSKLERLKKLERYFNNDNDINRRKLLDETKPNIKIAHSFAEYIVKTNVSMLLGSPITYTSTDNLEEFNKLLENADEQDINIDLANNCSIFGYAIQLIYLNENTELKFFTMDNKQVVLLYSNSIEEELICAIRFWEEKLVDDKKIEIIEIYTKNETRYYEDGELKSRVANMLNNIPIIVYKNNSYLKGDYENIIPLIDEYDIMCSDTANENAYFSNAYLFLDTDDFEIEDTKTMKETGIIWGKGLDPRYVTKDRNGSVSDIETNKNRVVKDIHKLSFTPDLSDENFANNVSGVAMEYKLKGTIDNIKTKERKFKSALNKRNALIFNIMHLLALNPPSYVDIIFTTNLPKSNLETVQMINQLRGIASQETLLSQLTFIQDPKLEFEKIKSEEENRFPKVKDTYED